MKVSSSVLPDAGDVASPNSVAPRIFLGQATVRDREELYRIRHDVYACELGQHPTNASGRLRDSLDDWNSYLVAKIEGEIVGFASLTPPSQPACAAEAASARRGHTYSIDKYFARATLPFPVDARLHEVRLLTVLKPYRGSELAMLLMYAALRWVEAHGGDRIAAIGRREILGFYCKAGLQPTGLTVQSGAVTYELMHASTARLRERLLQVAAVRALQDPAYYAARIAETARHREWLACELRRLGWDVVPGLANFLLCHLPANGSDAPSLMRRCRERGLFLRDASTMGPTMGDRVVRIAVRDADTNRRMVEVLRDASRQARSETRRGHPV